MVKRVLGLVLYCLIGHAGTVAGGDRSYWLRFTGVRDTTIGCGSESETYVFRDGVVVMKTIFGVGMTEARRGRASSFGLKELRRLLQENAVGELEGTCGLPFFQPNDELTFAVTWFGPGGRTTTIELTSPFGTPCPGSVVAIYEGVHRFIVGALYQGDVEIVEFASPPVPPCDGGSE